MNGLEDKIKGLLRTTFYVKRGMGFVWRSSPRWLFFNQTVQVIQGVLPVLSLYLLKMMVDEITSAAQGQGDYARILFIIILSGIVVLLIYLVGNLGAWGNGEQSRRLADYMSMVLMKKATRVDYGFFENSESLNKLHRAQEQAVSRPALIIESLAEILSNLVSLAGVLWIIISFHPLIVLILIAAALPGVITRMFFSSRQYSLERECTETERKSFYYQFLLLERSHAKEVRLFHLADHVIGQYGTLRDRLRKLRFKLDTRSMVLSNINSLISVALVFSAYGWVARDVFAGQVSVGEFVMFYQAFQRGQGFLRAFLGGFASLYRHNLFLQNLYEFLDVKPAILSPPQGEPLPEDSAGEVSFEKVSFAYPGTEKMVIDGLDLTIGKGQVVALVGLNGCGKTTLIKLLCRLYDRDTGSISFDGVDITRVNLNELRNRVGVIFQDFIQYNLTLKENIAFGDITKESSPEALDKAVIKAGAAELLADLPQGYDTMLGLNFERGKELSGGQWQKVAMARAFFKDSSLIILDEPTSALDPKAEYELFNRFKEILENKSALLVSHRMATVRMADKICVMEEGRITEEGTHGELMALKGRYYELFTMQASNYRD